MSAGSANAVELAITDSADPALREAIDRAIDRYNDDKMGFAGNQRTLVIPVRETLNGSVAGGLWGYTYARWLYIHLFVLPESLRGQGLGTRIMRMAEEEAVRRNCVGIFLDTFSFQARPFYERLGYQVFGTLEDFPPGHSRYFMRKLIAA